MTLQAAMQVTMQVNPLIIRVLEASSCVLRASAMQVTPQATPQVSAYLPRP